MNILRKSMAIVAVTSVLFFGCEKDDLAPQACLQVDNNYPAVGEFITFHDCSEDAFRVEINFGDGTYARYAPVEHSYSEKGSYTAVLSAWSKDGQQKSRSAQLIVVGGDSTDTGGGGGNNGTLPTACFTPSTTVAEPSTDISFVNCSLNASSFSWDFDDGSGSTAQNPVHAFSAPGSYDVTLTATNADGQADTSITITIGQRVLSKVILQNFNPLNSSGAAWDDIGIPIPIIPTEPDVYVELTSASGSTLSTDIESNLATSSLPITWDVSAGNLALTDEDWTVTIFDDEGFQGAPEVMNRWDNVNLGTLGGNQVIHLTRGSFTVDLEFNIQ